MYPKSHWLEYIGELDGHKQRQLFGTARKLYVHNSLGKIMFFAQIVISDHKWHSIPLDMGSNYSIDKNKF